MSAPGSTPGSTPEAAGRLVPYDNQATASSPDASVWVSASAGSGKTKVLADRVLRLLLTGADPGKVLCLTFTRAAAAEMQNRIRALLGRWATLDDDGLDEDILALTRATPDDRMRRNARKLFAEVLDTPGGLKIQTIHAFCESLLGRFPIEAGIPPHFEVMDERTADEALEAARDDILAAARADGANGGAERLAAALGVVTRWVQEDEFATLMTEIAISRGRLRRLFDAHGGNSEAIRAARAALDVVAGETVDALIAAACREDAFDGQALSRAVDILLTGGKQDVEKATAMAAWLEDPDGRAEAFDTYALAYLTGGGTIRATLASKGACEAMADLLDIMEREANRVLAVQERRKAILTAEATEAILTMATALIERYEAYKRQHALLDYDDLILKARALVEHAVPWVLFKLDGGIDHVLIDEAQDSNADQWAVVRAIADEFHAGEGAHEGPPRTVFAVGDEKQSIFSFQGAAPAEFARMSDHFERRTREADLKWERVPLDVSFRSASSVLRAVDAVFADEEVRAGVSHVPIRHQAHRRGQAGRVELWPPVMPDDRDDTAPWTPLDPHAGAGTPAQRLAHAIAGRIDRWIREKARLDSADRPIRPGDVLVLVRRRTDFVDGLIRELKLRSIDVAGVDRMVLTGQLAVQDLIALGAFALMPQDDLNLAAVLKGPLFSFPEERLFDVCHGRDGSVWQALRARAAADPACDAAAGVLSATLAAADTVPPYEFFSRILGPMKGRERILARLREEANDPIDEFLALALAYEQAHPASLQGFLHWLAEGQAEIARDLDQGVRDEVRIMTVHGSKGLQAPIVFLADTMQVPQPGSGLLWDDERSAGTGSAGRNGPGLVLWPPRASVRERVAGRLAAELRQRQDEEYRRLLYVAMTRAEDRLYVTGYGNRRKPPESCWFELVRQGLEPIAAPTAFDSHGGGSRDVPDMAWTGEGLELVNPQAEAPDRASRPSAGAGGEAALPGWALREAPAEPEPPQPLAPSRPATPEPAARSPIGDDRGRAFQRGVLIHRLLQTLPELAPADRVTAARRYLSRPVHDLDEQAIEALIGETLGVLDHPEFAEIFGPGARTEAPVAGTVNGAVISGRIDRLLIGPETVKVLDFKTNRPPPADESAVPETYLRQMAAYRALLQKIYADQSIECVLLWTDGPVLMPLSAQVLDAHSP